MQKVGWISHSNRQVSGQSVTEVVREAHPLERRTNRRVQKGGSLFGASSFRGGNRLKRVNGSEKIRG